MLFLTQDGLCLSTYKTTLQMVVWNGLCSFSKFTILLCSLSLFRESQNQDVPLGYPSQATGMFGIRWSLAILLLKLFSCFSSLPYMCFDNNQTGLPVAVKQILLKNIPGKLTNIRQKEITILKVCSVYDCCLSLSPSLSLSLLSLSVCMLTIG